MWLLTYPFKAAGPWLMALWTLVAFLISVMSLMALIGIVALGFATAMLLLYVADAIDRVSRGHTTPAPVVAAEVNPFQHPYIAVAACALLPLLYRWVDVGLSGEHLPLAAGVLFILAPVWFLTISAGPSSGFSPRNWWRFVRGLGVVYPAFAALVTSGVLGLVVAFHHGQFFVIALAVYLFVIAHLLAAKAVWLRRESLDLYTEFSPEQAQGELTQAEHDEWRKAFDELHRLTGAGEIQQAHTKLDIRLKRMHYEADDWVHHQLSIADPRLFLTHAYHYIDRLLDDGRISTAWLVCREALDADPLFRPSSAEGAMTLADSAEREHAPHVALLLDEFGSRFPDSPLLPRALFTLARAQFRDLGDPHSARATLTALAEQFPDDAVRSGVRQLDQAVEHALDA